MVMYLWGMVCLGLAVINYTCTAGCLDVVLVTYYDWCVGEFSLRVMLYLCYVL